MRKILIPLLLCAPVVALAAPAKPKPAAKPAATDAKDALEKVRTGELRLDGKISALLGEGVWQLEATSWTSPSGKTTDFDELKTKAVEVAPGASIHPIGETETVALKDVKLGSRVAIIGKSAPDGTVKVREVILLEGYGARTSVGTLTANRVTIEFIEQSRAARDAGQLPKALSLAQQAVAAAQGLNDLSGEALATQDMALLHSDLNQKPLALEAFQRAVSLGERLSNPLPQVLGLEGQAKILGEDRKFQEAVALLERATTLAAATPVELQISVLDALVTAYLANDQRTESIAALKRLFTLQDNNNKRDEATGSLLRLARLSATSDPVAARAALEQAAPRFQFARDEARLRLMVLRALALRALKDVGAATAEFEAAAKLAEERGDTQGAARIRALSTLR